jgi:phosphoglycolate phosphatase-like HAD superfamily hydrolase
MDFRAPRVIMFDLDGTLVDTMFAFADLAAELMATHHGDEPADARARYLATSGVPFHQQLEIIHPGHPANGLVSSTFERRKRAITRAARMDEATRAALAELRALGLKIVLSSNTGQEFVDEFTADEPFAFDLALGFDDTTAMAKGRPHVERTLAALDVTADDIWFVGDSLKDGELARANGLAFFVGRVGTFSAADFAARAPGSHTIELIEELVDLVAPPRAAARTAAAG